MPVEVGIWRIDDGVKKVHFSPIGNESKLETVLDRDIGVLDPNLMVVGRQVLTAHGKLIDLLAIDAQGDLTVVELKKGRTPREVVAQVLDYASWVQGLTYEQITKIYADKHLGQRFEQAFSERFGVEELPESLNDSHQLVVVASELDDSTERIIGYLSSNFGVPINAVFFRYFEEGGNEYLARTWLIDPDQVEAQASKAAPAKGKEPWNGSDFYVNIGEGVHRNWEDCRRYGFVSAGGGRQFTSPLEQLAPGTRVFAYIPQRGYVGVGIVREAPVDVRDFKVGIYGAETPLLHVPDLQAPNMAEYADDPERVERVVRVEWLKALPSTKQPVWEKGMYANPRTVTKLRNKFTLDRLVERFDLED